MLETADDGFHLPFGCNEISTKTKNRSKGVVLPPQKNLSPATVRQTPGIDRTLTQNKRRTIDFFADQHGLLGERPCRLRICRAEDHYRLGTDGRSNVSEAHVV